MTDSARCTAHTKQHRQADDQQRGSAHQRGYTRQWDRARLVYLSAHPLCVHCYDAGRVTAANVVDHIDPHRSDPGKFWNEANWQALCKPCHDAKTAKERQALSRGGK